MDEQLARAPEFVTALTTIAYEWMAEFLPRFGAAIAILIVGFIVAGWASRRVRALLQRESRIDATLSPVLSQTLYYAMIVVVLVAMLSQLGIQTASILAALGAVGLAIGLALQGTLSNIAAGVMLLWLRPFRGGEYIECGPAAGTVKVVGLFATELESFEGIFQFVPNSELWNTRIINYSRNPNRLMRIVVGISYGDDPGKAREALLKLAAGDERVLVDPAPITFVSELGDSAVGIELRAWARTAEFWDTLRDLTEQAKAVVEKEGMEIPFPQRVVHVVGERPALMADPT